jgi:hypothetical protein
VGLSREGPSPISRSVRYKKRKPSKKYMPAKPISVKIVSPLETVGEPPAAVFIKP